MTEGETTLVWKAASGYAIAWTSDPAQRERWKRQGIEPEFYGGGWRAEFPVSWVQIRRPRSEKQREAV